MQLIKLRSEILQKIAIEFNILSFLEKKSIQGLYRPVIVTAVTNSEKKMQSLKGLLYVLCHKNTIVLKVAFNTKQQVNQTKFRCYFKRLQSFATIYFSNCILDQAKICPHILINISLLGTFILVI